MSHSVRKIVKVGTSTAVVIPPHVLAHIGAERGDFMVFDITMKNFAIISLAPIPPYSEIAQQEEESAKPGGPNTLPSISPPTSDSGQGAVLRAAPKLPHDLSQDAGHDSGSPPVSPPLTQDPNRSCVENLHSSTPQTNMRPTDPTVQAPVSCKACSPPNPNRRAVDRVPDRPDELPVSHGLKPGRPSHIS